MLRSKGRYKGAGILFYKRVGKEVFISLGKRTIRPQKGYWSIPGGKMNDQDENDFRSCAIRETKEEYFSCKAIRFPINTVDREAKCSIIIPWFFEYHTYFANVSGPDISFNPNWEFSKVEWFSIKRLPAKTHIGVRYALLFIK